MKNFASSSKKLVLTLVLFILLFSTLIALEKKLVNNTDKIEVLKANRDIDIQTDLKEEYFDIVKVDSSDFDSLIYIKSKESLKDRKAKYKIFKDEFLINSKIVANDFFHTDQLTDNGRSISINIKEPADCMAGTLRKGDCVDILFTYKIQNNVITETVAQNLLISSVFDSSYKKIKDDDRQSIALNFIFNINPIKLAELKNYSERGKLTLLKCGDKSTPYEHIIINKGSNIQPNQQ